MTLGFSQEIKGVKNFFLGKIWQGLINLDERNLAHYCRYMDQHDKQFGKLWEESVNHKPKVHTIRSGIGRWRPGMDIHMVINNRTKNRFQFAPTIKCKRVQEIKITWQNGFPAVFVDGAYVNRHLVEKLAINDGFESVDDFFAYFNKDFTGTLIHWTELKY